MNIEPISEDHILRQITKEFRFRGRLESTQIGAVAEHLRASCVLLSLDNPQDLGNLSSTIQICRQVQRRLLPLFPDHLANPQVVSNELEKLDQLGDVIKVDSYRAVCGPSRRIQIDSMSSLLLGGGPLCALPLALRTTVEIAGRSRIVGATSLSSIDATFPFQRLEDWLELDNDDMLTWAAQYVRTNLNREKKAVPPDDLNIFVRNRWVLLDDFMGESDDYLARRRTTNYGNRGHEYSVLRLRTKDRVKKIDAFLEIGKDDARKLQGAIRTGKCVAEKMYFSFSSDETIEVTVPHPLAKAQSKLLLLGWECASDDTAKPWPRNIEFSRKATPLLARGLSLIGYELIEKRGK